MRIINGNLVLKRDTVFEGDVHVKGSILGKDGRKFNLTVKGNLIVWGDITAEDIAARDISAGNIIAGDITAGNITAGNITAGNITARDISYWAFCVAYQDITCKSIKGRRENSFHRVLDGKIKILKEAAK